MSEDKICNSTCTSQQSRNSDEREYSKAIKFFSKPDTTTEEVAQYLIDLSNENKQITGTINSDAEIQAKILVDLSNDYKKGAMVESYSFSQQMSKTTEPDVEIPEYLVKPITSLAAISSSSISPSSTSSHILSKESFVTIPANSIKDIPSASKEADLVIKNLFIYKGKDITSTDLRDSTNNSMEETVSTAKQNSTKAQKTGSSVLTKMSVDDIAMKLQTTTVLQNSSIPGPSASPTLSSSDSKSSVSTTSPQKEKHVPKKELMPDISTFLRKEMMKILPDMLQELYPTASGNIALIFPIFLAFSL